MATHAFVTTWLMAPGGSGALGVNWLAGMNLGSSKGVFKGKYNTGEIKITSCDPGGISWSWGKEATLGHGANPGLNGPDVFVWFRNKTTKQEIGGFLDRWTLDRPRKRDFGKIKTLWHMNPRLILAQSSHVMLGLQGVKGSACSKWTKVNYTPKKNVSSSGSSGSSSSSSSTTPSIPSTPSTPSIPLSNVPNWKNTTYASCWSGSNASERMMNVLSPRMPDSVFRQRLQFMLGRGCNTAHIILINQGDGEYAGYSPWGNGRAPNSGSCDAGTVSFMKSRIATLRNSGLAVVVWIITDDSAAWAGELFKYTSNAINAIKNAGLLDQASYVVLGLEMDEYGSASQWTALRNALRSAGYTGKIGVHHSNTQYKYIGLGDIVLDQLDPSKASTAAIQASVRSLIARGKDVVGFEYSRNADRGKAKAALAAGAFSVGNW